MKGYLLLFVLCVCFPAAAQEPSLYFEKITIQDGLSHNKVNCIIQDQRGFIWIGTDDGLNRYDGKRFVYYKTRPNDSTSISGNIITDLIEDRNGIIWIATADGGLSRYNYRLPPSLQFKQYKHKPGDPHSIPVNTINTLLEDPQGFLWLGTSGKSVLRFNKSNGRFTDPTQSSKTILDLCLDAKGLIWIGKQGGGIMKLDPATLSFTEDPRYKQLYAKLPHATVTALFKDRDQQMWFGSWDNVLFRQKPSGPEESFHLQSTVPFRDDEISSFAQDATGRIWMGGKEHGLHIYDPKASRFYNYSYNPAREGSISDNRINHIFIDRDGRVWLGTNRGICINNPGKQQFTQQFLTTNPAGNLTIYDFFEDENHNIWIGSSDGCYLKRPEGTIHHIPLHYKGNKLHITHFFKDRSGQMYLGTDYSLFRFDPVRYTVQLLPNTEKDSVMNRIIDSRVVSVVEDTIEGRPVLLTSPYGHFLSYYDLVQNQWISRLHPLNIVERFNLRDNLVRKLYKDSRGNIWTAGIKTGLGEWVKSSFPRLNFYMHDPSDPASISGNNVYDMREDVKGNLWVGIYGGGLNYFDVKAKSFTAIPSSPYLVEGLSIDHHQHVWMISNGRLHKYDPFKKSHESFELPDLEKTGGIKGGIFSDRQGKLYVAGINYFISFHPDSIRAGLHPTKVQLTDFQIFNKSFSHLLQQEKIRLHYRDNYFAFEFAAPDYASGTSVQYAYMLEGFDKDWVEAGDRNYVSYPNLEGGDYTFKVKATTTPGTWPKEFASVRISIVPPFWKTPWFYILCAVLLSIAVYIVYRYRINELLKRQAIRNRIAQDLHDNVGSTLSSISVYSQVARIYHDQHKERDLKSTLEKISSTSSEMISELNDTVWAINPRNDQMNVILQRMESFAKPLLAAQQIKLYFSYDRQLESVNLEMETRKNFYLIFKEAVNNVIKYAECIQLKVHITQEGQKIHMIIIDNGKGFDLSKTSEGFKSSDVFGGGNGLKNMQRRAAEMKGVLKMQSEPGNGTRLHLVFPIT